MSETGDNNEHKWGTSQQGGAFLHPAHIKNYPLVCQGKRTVFKS